MLEAVFLGHFKIMEKILFGRRTSERILLDRSSLVKTDNIDRCFSSDDHKDVISPVKEGQVDFGRIQEIAGNCRWNYFRCQRHIPDSPNFS